MFGKKNEKQELEIFVIFDSKSQTYGNPIHATNHLVLTRDILSDFNNPQRRENNQLFTNAEDFSVFRIGYYDKFSGKITTQNHEHVLNMHDLKAMVGPVQPAWTQAKQDEQARQLGIAPT